MDNVLLLLFVIIICCYFSQLKVIIITVWIQDKTRVSLEIRSEIMWNLTKLLEQMCIVIQMQDIIVLHAFLKECSSFFVAQQIFVSATFYIICGKK